MTFEEWWTQRETAAFNSLAGEDNAKAAWDYQQEEIAHWRAKCILLQDKLDEINEEAYRNNPFC